MGGEVDPTSAASLNGHMMKTCLLGIGLLSAACSLSACGGGASSCVGTGGVLLSPTCNEGWSESDCDVNRNEGVNGATWTYSTSSCVDQGYTEMCSAFVYRNPGSC